MKGSIHLIGCASCGFIASSQSEDRAKAFFCDHLVHSHPPPAGARQQMSDTCGTCRFFGVGRNRDPRTPRSEIIVGVCRRHAPVALIRLGSNVEGVHTETDFPNMYRSDWCGDYEAEP